jgi:tyrosine-protein kinase Etk/Wzc
MTSPENSSRVGSDDTHECHNADSIKLLDYLEIAVKQWRMMCLVASAALVLSLLYALTMTSLYNSTAKILPPQQESGMAGLMGTLTGGMASIGADLLGKSTPAELYVGILGSEVVKDAVIDRHGLMKYYNQKYRYDTYKILDNKVNISAGKKDGIISISVTDKDPRRAADIANAFVEELGKLTVKLNIDGAGQNRSFLEERLAKSKADLAMAEDSLKTFQGHHKLLNVTEQAKASIEGIAQLTAQMAVQEVQLATMRRQYTESAQEVKALRSSIENLRGQIARLEGIGNGGVIPNIGTVPQLAQEYLHLVREIKVQEAIYELLTRQYEMAKLTEAKDVSGMQILQKATVPDKKCGPMRTVFVITCTFSAAFGAVLYAFIVEALKSMTPADREQWRRIRSLLPGISSPR